MEKAQKRKRVIGQVIVIIDANIILSAIIRPDSQITNILLTVNSKIDFVLPEYALVEIKRHKERICKKSGIPPAIFLEQLEEVLSGVLIFSSNSLDNDTLLEAERIAAKVDANDTLYVAFSKALDGLLWTGDLKLYKGLRKNGFEYVVTTTQLLEIINGII